MSVDGHEAHVSHEGDGFYDLVDDVAFDLVNVTSDRLPEPKTPEGVVPDPTFCDSDQSRRWDNSLLKSERLRDLEERSHR